VYAGLSSHCPSVGSHAKCLVSTPVPSALMNAIQPSFDHAIFLSSASAHLLVLSEENKLIAPASPKLVQAALDLCICWLAVVAVLAKEIFLVVIHS